MPSPTRPVSPGPPPPVATCPFFQPLPQSPPPIPPRRCQSQWTCRRGRSDAGRQVQRTRQLVAAPGSRPAAAAPPQPRLLPPPTPPPTRPTPADSDGSLRFGSATSPAVPSLHTRPSLHLPVAVTRGTSPRPINRSGRSPSTLTSSIRLVVPPFAIIEVAVGILVYACPANTHTPQLPPHPHPPAAPFSLAPASAPLQVRIASINHTSPTPSSAVPVSPAHPPAPAPRCRNSGPYRHGQPPPLPRQPCLSSRPTRRPPRLFHCHLQPDLRPPPSELLASPPGSSPYPQPRPISLPSRLALPPRPLSPPRPIPLPVCPGLSPTPPF